MSSFWQALLEFLQKFFMLIGSLVTFAVGFYLGIALVDQYDYWAKREIPSCTATIEARINRYSIILHVFFWILSIMASIGIIAFNFTYVGVVGGVLAIIGCLVVNMLALVD